MKCKKVGFESQRISYNLYHRYLEAIDTAVLVPIERLIDQLRISKNKKELAALKKSAQIAESAFEETLESLKPGITESQWALELECAIRRAGSGPVPFDVIVASGERGSMPHAQAGSKKIKNGEFVTISASGFSFSY